VLIGIDAYRINPDAVSPLISMRTARRRKAVPAQLTERFEQILCNADGLVIAFNVEFSLVGYFLAVLWW